MRVFMRGRGLLSFSFDRSSLASRQVAVLSLCRIIQRQRPALLAFSYLKCLEDFVNLRIKGPELETLERPNARKRERERSISPSSPFFFESPFASSSFFGTSKLTRNDRGSSGLARTASLTAASTCLSRQKGNCVGGKGSEYDSSFQKRAATFR